MPIALSLYIMRTSNRKTHEQTLMIMSGLIAGLVVLAQMNIHEVLRVDRFQHIAMSALMFAMLFSLMKNHSLKLLAPVFIVLSVGLLKELNDPIFSDLDMVANVFGVSLGFLVMMTLQKLRLA